MRAYDIIAKKRDGEELSSAEIDFLVQGYTRGDVKDYQMSAWAMAVFLRGMSHREIADLTISMVKSGEVVDLSSISGKKVDKHSTGGVGDKTTLVLAPMVAAAGVKVAKLSGRGLGHTGGTLDKLEAIPGFRVDLSREEFLGNVQRIGIALAGQTGNIVPADKKLYALRDVTATVNSIPLIASSVMSKKIASGADAIVLDVKAGSGALMKTEAEASRLAQTMVGIGALVGRKTVALVTDMDQPLGNAVGNALEVQESIDTLKGRGPKDLTELCLALGSEMLLLAGISTEHSEARQRLEDSINNGSALDKFKEFVCAQHGNPSAIEDYTLLPQARFIIPVLSERSGYVNEIQAEAIGRSAMLLGAGRETKESEIDLAVGVVLAKKRGERCEQGEIIAYIHTNDQGKAEFAASEIKSAYTFTQHETVFRPLIHARFDSA